MTPLWFDHEWLKSFAQTSRRFQSDTNLTFYLVGQIRLYLKKSSFQTYRFFNFKIRSYLFEILKSIWDRHVNTSCRFISSKFEINSQTVFFFYENTRRSKGRNRIFLKTFFHTNIVRTIFKIVIFFIKVWKHFFLGRIIVECGK